MNSTRTHTCERTHTSVLSIKAEYANHKASMPKKYENASKEIGHVCLCKGHEMSIVFWKVEIMQHFTESVCYVWNFIHNIKYMFERHCMSNMLAVVLPQSMQASFIYLNNYS